MSDDLVTWLREAASRHNNYRCDEAADRIEELEREKMSWKGVYDGAITAMTERIEALEAALRYVDANMVGNDHGHWEMLPDFRYGVIHAVLGEKKDD